ncbi:S9 family peptidase [Rickettsiales endosymbiont of Trichoplax sp. H2]|uniref:S9 family peptidase n=1 Tax=Rickettsiales endosymbiont of Trichoplax sp. H2 TaxID=2021221 RepID=UPI0018A83EF0|nr:S9 family peptidase [Rickettsiales endosymbiont of Trichoplax sp. H2]
MLNKVNNQPTADKINHLVKNHHEEINDYYYWLRDKNWPNVFNKEIINHLKSENTYTNKFFEPLKELESSFYKELKNNIIDYEETYPIKKDNFFYFSKVIKDKNYPVICRKYQSMDANEEIILDQNQLAQNNTTFAMGTFSVSQNHKLLAYSVDLNGKENYTINIKDLDSNKLSNDNIHNTIGNIIWDNDNKGFFYIKLNKNWKSNSVYYHELNNDQSFDKLVFKENDESFHIKISKSSDNKYLFIYTSSLDENEVWFINLEYATSHKPTLLYKRQHKILYSVEHKNNYFYIKINDKGENFRLIKINVKSFSDISKSIEIIPHNKNSYLTSISLSKNYLLLNKKVNGIDKIIIFDNFGKPKEINFNEKAYSALGYFPTYDSNLARISYSSLITPDTTFEYDYNNKKLITRKIKKVPNYNKNLYYSERVYAKAPDNTLIPISLVYKKDLFKNNSNTNPLLLYGYGAYGHSIKPSFNEEILPLINKGVIFAIAHVRGGDDLGYNWHQNAKFLNKKITFSDFISCAEHLIKDNYTSSENLIISGESAGGMLIGAVINERPDLFKIAITRVPFVDVLNTMLDSSLPLTSIDYKEWGNPKDIVYYNYIKSYSPYDNVKSQQYPSIFVTSGLNDPRVTYWESAKWVAKLREFNISNNPILLYTEMNSGHNGQSGRYNSLKEVARFYTFIFNELNKK